MSGTESDGKYSVDLTSVAVEMTFTVDMKAAAASDSRHLTPSWKSTRGLSSLNRSHGRRGGHYPPKKKKKKKKKILPGRLPCICSEGGKKEQTISCLTANTCSAISDFRLRAPPPSPSHTPHKASHVSYMTYFHSRRIFLPFDFKEQSVTRGISSIRNGKEAQNKSVLAVTPRSVLQSPSPAHPNRIHHTANKRSNAPRPL